jgi:type IV pilus assembly protein PilN
MYSIDVNLLRDRLGVVPDGERGPAGPASNTPLIFGGVAAVAAVGLVLIGYGLISFRNYQLVAEEQQLEDELSKIVPQLAQLEKFKAEEERVNSETQALATIFNQIKPWSSTLQDVSGRVPATLQIAKVEQSAPPPPAPAPAGDPPPAATATPQPATPPQPASTSLLTFTGKARSFGDINDFVLTLQKSPFLDNESVKLIQAERPGGDKASKTTLVDYKITSALSGVPASDLLQELSQNGAKGLVSRIDFLKQKGVIKP